MGVFELIFVDPGVNVQYYHHVLLSQQIPAIKHVADDTFVFQQDNSPSHRVKDTIKLLQQETEFIGPDLWPPNSPDLNPVLDYKVWGVMQQRVYECCMNSVDELKQRLIGVWNSQQQNVTDAAINEWRKRLRMCVCACRWTTF